ncbi:hypothetical protein BLJAPNOD_05107 [Ensifer sp. M14]|jgi:hypothetical protein|uniref:hypothetical protein n=1 Tax=Ensifer sp. M14 TaxID=2203782 RepID=UPI000E1C8863|nr:hypothetical protein [Ensifer sp. M14]RDL47882.1 hypothetical protein BLJAPNOD_05107 [Ensifer sp. M14]
MQSGRAQDARNVRTLAPDFRAIAALDRPGVFDFANTPINEPLVRELATGTFVAVNRHPRLTHKPF